MRRYPDLDFSPVASGRLFLPQNNDRAELVEGSFGHFPRRVPFELEGDAGNVGKLEGGAALRIQFVIGLSGNAHDERVLSAKRHFQHHRRSLNLIVAGERLDEAALGELPVGHAREDDVLDDVPPQLEMERALNR